MCVCRGSHQGRDVKLKWSGDSQWVKVKGLASNYCETGLLKLLVFIMSLYFILSFLDPLHALVTVV